VWYVGVKMRAVDYNLNLLQIDFELIAYRDMSFC
jgi:hypothetical protein